MYVCSIIRVRVRDLTWSFFAYSQYIDFPEASFYHFSLEKLALLSLVKEVKRSPDRKMIELLTFDVLFSPPRHSRKNSYNIARELALYFLNLYLRTGVNNSWWRVQLCFSSLFLTTQKLTAMIKNFRDFFWNLASFQPIKPTAKVVRVFRK